MCDQEKVLDRIQREFESKYGDNIIGDGIINLDRYLAAKYKILWIMKEAYDEDGGGWCYSEVLSEHEKIKGWINGGSKPTWHPIIYVSHSILNGFPLWCEMPYISDSESMCDVLLEIAVINAKKQTGTSQSDNNEILEFYEKDKDLIIRQIEAVNPDIVIGVDPVLRKIYEDLKVPVENGVRRDGRSCEYIKTPERLYITVYHPAQRMFTREKYVDDIVMTAKEGVV